MRIGSENQSSSFKYKLKIVYVHRNPDLHPRTNKIRQSLTSHGFEFEVFRPRLVIKSGNRTLSAFINYSSFFLQSLFIKGDIIWVANCPDTAGLGPWLCSRNYIYDYRSPWSKEVELEFGKGPLSKLARIIELRVRSKARAIVIVSSQMHSDVQHLGKPIFVIPNYPTKDFAATREREDVRKLWGLSPEKKVVLFVGKLSKVEGADMLRRIVEGLLDSSSEVVMWIVGDGPLRQEIEALEKKYPDSVRFFGWVNHTEVPNHIVAADICIVPRHQNIFAEHYNEQGVQKIAEYLALGKPVVACNIGKSDNYVLVEEDNFVQGILDALARKTPSRERRFWEDYSEPTLIEAINRVLFSHHSGREISRT